MTLRKIIKVIETVDNNVTEWSQIHEHLEFIYFC